MKLSLAGSVAVTDITNEISSTLGDHVKVNLAKQSADSTILNGDMNVTARSNSNARVIAGAMSVAPSKFGAGVTVAVMANKDDVKATTGSHARIDTAGKFRQNAKADGDIQLFTVAAAVGTGDDSKLALGGALLAEEVDEVVGGRAEEREGLLCGCEDFLFEGALAEYQVFE